MSAPQRLSLGLVLLLAGCGPEGATPGVSAGPPEPLPVEARAVRFEDGYRVRSLFTGRVMSRRTSDLGFDRGGRLEAVQVDEGDRVEAGGVLARLDTRELAARRRELEAQVAEIRARLSLAGLTAERRARLLASESISRERSDEALYDERALAARLAAARAAIENVEVALDLSRLVAPYAGSITERLADEGSIVSPGQVILRIIEDGSLEVRVGVPPETAARLSATDAYEVEIEGRRHPARLSAVVGRVDPETRTVTAIFGFAGPQPPVRSGSLARVAIETRVADRGFWLPIDALSESRRGLWSAYALVQDGNGDAAGVLRVERRELQVLYTESDRVFVRGTLRDGEQVVASGLHRLVPGQRVRLAR